MIKFENTEVVGIEHAIRGMRNPMNSWDKSDSSTTEFYAADHSIPYKVRYEIGPADLKLASKLVKAGTDHRKFLRMINVYVDITAPLYWWKEFDTYKVGTVANSCSTMHTIADKEFGMDDFSHEHLFGLGYYYAHADEPFATVSVEGKECHYSPEYFLQMTCDMLNGFRQAYLDAKENGTHANAKRYWYNMIQLLPSSYNQKRTVMLNYEVLANIYHSRRNHKLDEWRNFCFKFIAKLPYADYFLTQEKLDEDQESLA